jgi:PKD repeat protein
MSESNPSITLQSLSTSIDVNIAFVLDSNGVLKKTHDQYGFLDHSGEFRQLIGDNNGFYLFLRDSYCHLNRFSVNGYNYPRNGLNETYTYFNGRETLNNIHSVVTTSDSIFIYANDAPYKGTSFCLKISKIDGRSSRAVVATNGRHNGAFASKVYPNTTYSFGADYSFSPAIAMIKSVEGVARRVFSFSELATVTKCVEDEKGQLYALLRLSDDVLVTKLDANTGASIWTYRHPVTRDIRSYDIDVSTENNTVIIALLKHSSDWKEQNSSFFILNASNGEFIKQESMDGSPNTQNNILFIRNIVGVGILIGGNLNTDSLGGPNGFCMVSQDTATYDPPIECHLKPYFAFSAIDQTFSTIKFTDLTTGGRQPLSYSWNFNDGSNLETIANPQHRFYTAGVYQICLEVKDSLGCLKVYCDEISIPESTDTVDCNVTVNFRYEPSNVVPGEIHFINLSRPDTATYRWTFGDGSIQETSINPIHLYAVGGKYQVCLTTMLSPGCQQTFCDTVNVSPTVAPLRTKASPNPATMELYLDFLSNHATNVEISCRTINGNQQYKTTTNVSPGINHIAIPVANFPPGIYFVVVSGNGIHLKTKFVKL